MTDDPGMGQLDIWHAGSIIDCLHFQYKTLYSLSPSQDIKLMKRGSKLTTIVSTMLVVLMILLIVYTGSRYDELKEELAIRQMHFLNQRPAEISQ